MQAFLEYVVKGLVEHPSEVTITSVDRGGMTVYELRMNPGDVGRIIGRQGVTINAIRSLLLAGGAGQGVRWVGGDRATRTPFRGRDRRGPTCELDARAERVEHEDRRAHSFPGDVCRAAGCQHCAATA